MISIDKLSEILNNELNKEFLEAALDLYNDGDMPIDPEHPIMEVILETITESINESMDILPIEDKYTSNY